MAKIKIILDKNETEEEVQEQLIKAITQHADGSNHKEDFQDPAARDVVRKMGSEFDKMLKRMFKEINEALDEGV